MARIDRLRTEVLRWDRLAAIASVAVPFAVTSVLGFLWLGERGYFLWFVAVCIGFGSLVALARLLARRWQRRQRAEPAEGAAATPGVLPDPDWGPTEAAAFAEARAFIRARTEAPVPWPEMQGLALEVVTRVATRSGAKAGGREALDFTLPEALLLIERVSARFRGDLREMVPFSDSVSLATLLWIWRQRDRARALFGAGQKVWRVARAFKNLPAAIIREIDSAVAGGHSSYLTTEAMAVLQAILLEEVAKAAVDLYSGRLRFSDAELLDIQLAGGEVDRARLATPDAPLRIVFAGQASAGKSSLINALTGADRAETDARPTTDRPVTYEIALDGLPCVLVDTPGLDGGRATREAVLREMAAADVLVWVARANRPARGIDHDVLAAWEARFAAEPVRRQPPLVAVASCADTLVEGWPLPEHALTPEARDRISAAVQTIGADLDGPLPIPVSAQPPDWNLQALRQTLSAVLGEGLMVQRNRARLAGGRSGARTEATRAGRGMGRGLRSFGQRLARRSGVAGD